MEKRQKVYKIIMLMFLTAFFTFLGTTIYISKYGIKGNDKKYVILPTSSENSEIGEELSRIKTVIDKHYLRDVDENKLKTAAIKGYVEGLEDEYSEYYTPEELEDFYADALRKLFRNRNLYGSR